MKALLIIDMQVGIVGGIHDAAGLVSRLADLRTRARDHGCPVVLVQHHGGGLTPGSRDWQITSELSPTDAEVVVQKLSADSFLETDLEERLNRLGVTEVIVCGAATDFCVDSTARSALAHGFDVTLVSDGHSTTERPDSPDAEAVSAAQVIAHHNTVFTHIIYPKRKVRVMPAAEVKF